MGPAAFARELNTLGLLAVTLVLAAALLLQLALGELPCPLCLLQRVGFIAVGFGLLLNVRFGPAPLHYGLVILGALYGAAAAGRQVLLHIVPGSGAYGSPLFGIHLYTWSLVLFLVVVAGVALLLMMEGQFERVRAWACCRLAARGDGPLPRGHGAGGHLGLRRMRPGRVPRQPDQLLAAGGEGALAAGPRLSHPSTAAAQRSRPAAAR